MAAVAEDLGTMLADARRAGLDFDTAWTQAVATVTATDVEAEAWKAALGSTRHAWARAWSRRPPCRAERAVLALVVEADREPGDGELQEDDELRGMGPGSACWFCGEALPAGKMWFARYCGRPCQRAANGRPSLAAAA